MNNKGRESSCGAIYPSRHVRALLIPFARRRARRCCRLLSTSTIASPRSRHQGDLTRYIDSMFGCMYALRGPALHFAAPSSSAARAALGKQAAAATAASFSTDATMTGRLLQLNDLSNIDEATKKVRQWTTFSAGSFSLAI